MSNNTNLFGCCSGEKNHIISEYQYILAKALIEDREFFDEMLPGLDVNETFLGVMPLKTIIGTLIDMRARYKNEVTYDALEIEVVRKTRDKYNLAEVKETFERLREDIPVEKQDMCKEQFIYWKQFVVLARIGNACVDMLKEPWFMSDAKLNKMIGEVQDLAGRMEQVTGGTVSKSNDWTV